MSNDRPSRRAARAARAALTGTLLLGASTLAAQAPAAQPPAAQLPWLQTLSVNPLAIPLGIFSAEYEVALPTPGLTVAIGGTYTANSDIFERRERWLTARVMYYPNEVQLRGLSLGLTLGARRAERAADDGENVRGSEGAPTLGIMAGYNWIIGSQQRLVLGGGIGAARVLKNVDSNSPLNQVYPDGRILVGIAF